MRSKNRFYREVFLIAFAGLLLEISYTRIFSHKFLYFFTYLVVGIALMGLGSGGVSYAVSKRLRKRDLADLFPALSLIGAISVVAGYLIIAPTGVDTLHLFKNAYEPIKLVLVSLVLFVPFWCIGTLLSAVFGSLAHDVNRLYGIDLAGAALGCVVAVPLIMLIGPPGCVMLAAAALSIAGVRLMAGPGGFVRAGAITLTIGCIGFAIFSDLLPDTRSVKGVVTQTEAQTGAVYVPVFSAWGPIFRVDAVEVRNVPKPAIVLFHDGLPGSSIVKCDGDPKAMDVLGVEPAALPFAIAGPSARVLIIGAAGGHEVLTSLYHDAEHVTGVELNPVTHGIVTGEFADYAGRFHEKPNVDYLNGEGRSFLARDTSRYDLIYFVAPDSYSATNAATASAFVLSESYLYTVEMVQESLEHLSDDGLIAMQFGEFAYDARPNRTIRYLATAREAFRRMGIADFQRHVIVATVKGYINESFILLKRTPMTNEDIAALEAKLAQVEGGKLRYAPGRAGEPGPVTTVVTIPDANFDDWVHGHQYEIHPVTDNAPFFWHFVRFSDIMRGSVLIAAGLVHYDPEEGLGERVLLFTVAFCSAFALVFLLLPFVVVRSTWKQLPRKLSASVYFACLGLGFMAYEICLIQKFTLFLGYPTYTLTVTLMSMLVFAGIGSMWAGHFANPREVVPRLFAAIALLTVFYQLGAPRLIELLIGAPLGVRIAITIALLAPLSLCLGAYMPLGLSAVSRLTSHGAEYIAWGWAINGFFSVISSLLTIVLSMAYGFRWVLFVSLCLYALATLLYRRISVAGAARGAEG